MKPLSFGRSTLMLGTASALVLGSFSPALAVDASNPRITGHSFTSPPNCNIVYTVDTTNWVNDTPAPYPYDDSWRMVLSDANGATLAIAGRETPALLGGATQSQQLTFDRSTAAFPLSMVFRDRRADSSGGNVSYVDMAPLTVTEADIPNCATNQPPSPLARVNWSYVYSGRPGVILDATGSSDPEGDAPLTYQWTQTLGPAVTLSDPTNATPQFTAPIVSANTNLNFSLEVTDSFGNRSSQQAVVAVVVTPDACTVYNQARLLDEFPILTQGPNSSSGIRIAASKVEATLTQWLAAAQASNAQVSGASLTVSLSDLGNGAIPAAMPGQPAAGAPLHFASLTQNGFTIGNQTGAVASFWDGAPIKTGQWYRLHTNLRPVHNGGGMSNDCTDAGITFRLPKANPGRTPLNRNRPVELWDAKSETISTISIRTFTLPAERKAIPARDVRAVPRVQ